MTRMYFGACIVTLLVATPAVAQRTTPTPAAEAAPLQDITALMHCVSSETTEMNRLRELAAAAERQNRQARDAAARADARTAVDSLKRQIWARNEHIARCFQTHRPLPFEGATGAAAAPTTTTAGHPTSDDRVAVHGPTLHATDSERRLGANVRVVRGVRLDGVEGAVPDDSVRTALNGVAQGLESCARATPQVNGSQLVLEFEVRSNGQIGALQTVERVGSSPETARCFESAFRSMQVSMAHGRSAYGYTFALGVN